VLPADSAVRVVKQVAAGDLTKEIPVRSQDELGELGRMINEMIRDLKDLIGKIRESAEGLPPMPNRSLQVRNPLRRRVGTSLLG